MPDLVMLQHEPVIQTVAIAAAGNITGAIRMPPGHYLTAIVMPAAWTAANLTFQGSADGATYNNLYDDADTELTVTAAAARMLVLPPANWCAVPFLKIRSGTAAVPVAQAAARSLVLITRRL